MASCSPTRARAPERGRCGVIAKYILAGLGAVFLIAALLRLSRGGGVTHPQTRTWLLIAVIFATVSGWLFYRT